MTLMLNLTRDPTTLKDALPNFSRTTHIFLPINDNRDPDLAEGGSHWSLLLVSLIDGVAFHYDSLAGDNTIHARSAMSKLSDLMGQRLRFVSMVDTPQQENGSDCGVFVCLMMRTLLIERLLKADSSMRVSMSMRGAVVDAKSGRKEMMKTIDSFRKEGERRRSYVATPPLPPVRFNPATQPEVARWVLESLADEFETDSRSVSPFGRKSSDKSPPRIGDD